jgi:hypothetical protein
MNELGKKRTVFIDAMPCSLLSTYISEKPAASISVGGGRCSRFLLNVGTYYQTIGFHREIQSFFYIWSPS